MSSKNHSVACDSCSRAGSSNPLGTPVAMEWQWEAPGHGGHMTQVYRCPACGGQIAVQQVSEELAAQPLGGDELLPQSWSENAMPTLADLEVDRQEINLETTGAVDAMDFRKTILGGDTAPSGPPIGFETYYDRAIHLYGEAMQKSQAGASLEAYQDYANALSSLQAFVRIAPSNDHRLAAANQMIGQLEHAGIS